HSLGPLGGQGAEVARRAQILRAARRDNADLGDRRAYLVDRPGGRDVRAGCDHPRMVAAEAGHQRLHRRAEGKVLRAARVEALMYRRILVAVENSGADRTIIDHISELAKLTGAELLLVHVADGWAARNFDQLQLRESEEMKADRCYLEQLRTELVGRGLTVETRLAMGDPATELIKVSQEGNIDLIAMSTHGHPFVKAVLLAPPPDRAPP